MRLHNLEGRTKSGYTTWGCMWDRGTCMKKAEFGLRNADTGETIPMQSRVTAYWPDGSIKWTAHTADAGKLGTEIEVMEVPGKTPTSGEQRIKVIENNSAKIIDAGKLKIEIPADGVHLFEQVCWEGRPVLYRSRPILILEEPGMLGGNKICLEKDCEACIKQVEIEEAGALQVIVKYSGCHNWGDETKIPFIIRLKVGLDSNKMDMIHTFLYDGDEEQDYLKGLGIRIEAPLTGPVYNRHVKFTGDHGVFHESMAQLLSWRPKVPAGIYRKQMNGERLVLQGEEREIVETVLKDMPFWSEYELCQHSASYFAIRKKINADNCCYVDCLSGLRTEGAAAFGSESGSILLGIRDFWEKYPSGYTFRNLDQDMAEATIWFWPPRGEVMDFRHYANRGYNQVYYEGYDYKGATPFGIACTNECSIQFGSKIIPSDTELKEFADIVRHPAQFVGTPDFYHEKRAFGCWSLPQPENETETWLEGQLAQAFDFYRDEVSRRGWYGMFNYGDFMHTYDHERHQWRYDMGGYAWDNTELVPTLWLWYYFMRTGREDVFTLAEKLSRHTSEVDVYHLGRYKGLGSRHNVRHWGCPCKEARIAMAAHHRFYYYLTGDRRLEDIFEELKDNEKTFLHKDPLADFYDKADMVYESHARSGPDWSSLCANWMTRWERFNDPVYRDKIVTGMEDIKAAPLKLISGPDFEFDPERVRLRYIGERAAGGTHLQICMGAPQIWMEMADLLEDEEWKQMMADYGRFYYLPRAQQLEESHGLIGEREFTLPFMAAAMGAYGAAWNQDPVLAERTWQHLLHALIHDGNHDGFKSEILPEQGNCRELWEIPWISTNFTAQWCLNVIVVLEFIRAQLPPTMAAVDELVALMPEELFRKA